MGTPVIIAALESAKVQCLATMAVYQPKSATVVQMREYAGCVHRVYGSGEPWYPVTLILIKAAIVVLILSMPVGAVVGWRSDEMETRLASALWGAFFGVAIAALIMGALIGVWFGVSFIGSAG